MAGSTAEQGSLDGYYKLIKPTRASYTRDQLETRLNLLRRRILMYGLPKDPIEAGLVRPLAWKLLLELHVIPSPRSDLSPASADPPQLNPTEPPVHPLLSADTFYSLISREPSPMFSKIKNDSFRTLATDEHFRTKVGEEKLVRCLEGFVWRQLDAAADRAVDPHLPPPTIDPGTPYVQGMNVLAAPFLFVLPSQLEAFACFTAFIETHAPRHVRPTLEGVHAGLRLVDLCLAALDPALYAHLLSHNLTAELYAFPSLLTFCACTPPLEEVLELWDFLLAWGAGLNVLCVVAQVVMVKEKLVASASPMKLLRTFPALQTREIITLTVQFLIELPGGLYEQVVRHPWDDSLVVE